MSEKNEAKRITNLLYGKWIKKAQEYPPKKHADVNPHKEHPPLTESRPRIIEIFEVAGVDAETGEKIKGDRIFKGKKKGMGSDVLFWLTQANGQKMSTREIADKLFPDINIGTAVSSVGGPLSSFNAKFMEATGGRNVIKATSKDANKRNFVTERGIHPDFIVEVSDTLNKKQDPK